MDDNESGRSELRRLVEIAGYQVKDYPSAESFVAELRVRNAEAPAVVFADLGLPKFDGIVLAWLAGDPAAPPVVFLSAHGQFSSSVRAMKRGAIAFLEKPVTERELLDALDCGFAESRQRISERRLLDEIRTKYATLTPRERQVCTLVVSGMLNKQVAAELGVSEKMVKVHRARMLRKMGAQSLPHLVRMAVRLGPACLPPPGGRDERTSCGGGPPPSPRD